MMYSVPVPMKNSNLSFVNTSDSVRYAAIEMHQYTVQL